MLTAERNGLINDRGNSAHGLHGLCGQVMWPPNFSVDKHLYCYSICTIFIFLLLGAAEFWERPTWNVYFEEECAKTSDVL